MRLNPDGRLPMTDVMRILTPQLGVFAALALAALLGFARGHMM